MLIKYLSYAVLLTFAITACTTKNKGESPKSWSGQMLMMGDSFNEIIPFVFDNKEFANPKNKKKVLSKIKNLQKASEHITEESAEKLLGNDPIVLSSVRGLQEDLKSAASNFDNGHIRYAQNILQSTVGFCYQCHTRTNFGAENVLQVSDLSFQKISDPVQRSKAYVATRQYEKALENLKKSLSREPANQTNVYKAEKILKTYLTIAIKSDRPVDTSIDLLKNYKASRELPYYLSENISAWLKSLERFKRVKGKAMNISSVKENPRATYDADYVDSLIRAEFYHGQIMRRAPNLSNSYLELARVYDKYPEIGFWDLAERYYQACIDQSPKSSISKTCYRELERTVYSGFSGSGGVNVPAKELESLRIYKEKAGL